MVSSHDAFNRNRNYEELLVRSDVRPERVSFGRWQNEDLPYDPAIAESGQRCERHSPFCNAGITLHVEPNGLGVCCANTDQFRCVFNSMGGPRTGDPIRDVPAVDAMSGRKWVQILDDEARVLLAKDKDDGLLDSTILITFPGKRCFF
jgi:hypothetical protein